MKVLELANVKMSMNPFDEIAVEEAIRLKEQGKASEIVAVSIGPQQATETIRTALAMGADRGILVTTDQTVEPLAVAKILKMVVERESPQLVIMGMKAKKKPLDELTPEALGVDVTPRLKVLKTVEPGGRKAGVKVGSVGELVQKLKVEAGAL